MKIIHFVVTDTQEVLALTDTGKIVAGAVIWKRGTDETPGEHTFSWEYQLPDIPGSLPELQSQEAFDKKAERNGRRAANRRHAAWKADQANKP
jgi:hypothetical protein